MRGEFLDVNGVRLYYYAAGSRGAGEPILLLHGFPTSGHLWNRVVPLLPEGHRVVVLDLLGYGRSDPPGRMPMGLRAHADRVVAVLDHLRIEVACIAGHDLGGGIAQSVAVRHPGRVSRMCLVNSACAGSWPTRSARLARTLLPITRRLPAPWIHGVLKSELLRGYQDSERAMHEVEIFLRPFAGDEGRAALVAHLAGLSREETGELSEGLRAVTARTAILWGELDPFLSPTAGRRLQSAIPGSTFEVVSGAKHFLPIESAGTVAASVRSLLAS